MKPLLTIEQAAETLNVSERQVKRLIKSGRLKAVDLGSGKQRKLTRINPKDIEAMIEGAVAKKPATKRQQKKDQLVNRY